MNSTIVEAVTKATAVAAADSFRLVECYLPSSVDDFIALTKVDSYVWYAVAGFGVLSIAVACLTLENYDRYLTDEVSRKLRSSKPRDTPAP